MAVEADPATTIELIEEDDGRVTPRHKESGVASFGQTDVEAIRNLANALECHLGMGDSIEDPESYLEERNVDVDIGSEGPPPWMAWYGRPFPREKSSRP